MWSSSSCWVVVAITLWYSSTASGFSSLQEVRDALGWKTVYDSMAKGCGWLTDVSLIRTSELPDNCANVLRINYTDWRGVFRNEYGYAEPYNGKFSFYEPTWHGGQDIKALCAASAAPHPPEGVSSSDAPATWMEAARLGIEFILRTQVKGGIDDGLVVALGGPPGTGSGTSTALEGLDALLVVSNATGGNETLVDSFLRAAKWYADKAWMKGEGLLADEWLVEERKWVKRPGNARTGQQGRPLIDDSVFLWAYRNSGNTTLRDVYFDIAERLMTDEDPPGNWVWYVPCNGYDYLHPRQAYWWGRPFVEAYRETKDRKYLDVARRAAQWYIDAQRVDGGMFRTTLVNFTTSTYGQVGSGSACAALLFMDVYAETRDDSLLFPLQRALSYLLTQQFTKGAVLENSLNMDNTDAIPYHLRDIATSFTVQAFAMLLDLAGRGL